jgi:hypothetical protein
MNHPEPRKGRNLDDQSFENGPSEINGGVAISLSSRNAIFGEFCLCDTYYCKLPQ